jgi:hypothetical protein
VSGNSGGYYGGGIYNRAASGQVSLTNSIVLGNSDAEINGGFANNGGNLVGGANAEDVFASIDATTGGGLLDDNGGPVLTIALKQDAGNPALDAAETDGSFTIESSDARGEDAYDAPGVANGTGNDAGRDIGAYELVNETPLIATVSDTQIAFTDPDVDDTHEAAITEVSILGDQSLLDGFDVSAFLTLGAVDQVADTVDWQFDLPQAAAENVSAGLGVGETLSLDYTVGLTDLLGESDQTVLSFTIDDEGILA